MTLPAAFTSKISPPRDCHLWTGAVNTKGYGCYAVAGVSQLAHRLAYEDANGPIPAGLTIDHLCRVRNCVNPAHLQAVTDAENKRRARRRLAVGGECRHGHAIVTEGDLYARANGSVECVSCLQAGRLCAS